MKLGWPKRIVFVRHAESEGNVRLRDDLFVAGWANHALTLTELGRKQAQETGDWLRNKYGGFDVYFVSTFLRTQETLRYMYPDAQPHVDSRLNELWRGIWHSMPERALHKAFPYESEICEREGIFHYAAPGGQSGADVETKIHLFLQGLRLDYAGDNILVVTHGYWMLLLWRILQNHPVSEYERRYTQEKYKNCALCVYEYSGGRLKSVLDGMVVYNQN